MTPQKKLRFRGDLNLHHFQENRLEEIHDGKDRRDSDRISDVVDGKKDGKDYNLFMTINPQSCIFDPQSFIFNPPSLLFFSYDTQAIF